MSKIGDCHIQIRKINVFKKYSYTVFIHRLFDFVWKYYNWISICLCIIVWKNKTAVNWFGFNCSVNTRRWYNWVQCCPTVCDAGLALHKHLMNHTLADNFRCTSSITSITGGNVFSSVGLFVCLSVHPSEYLKVINGFTWDFLPEVCLGLKTNPLTHSRWSPSYPLLLTLYSAPIESIVRRHGLIAHLYADDIYLVWPGWCCRDHQADRSLCYGDKGMDGNELAEIEWWKVLFAAVTDTCRTV